MLSVPSFSPPALFFSGLQVDYSSDPFHRLVVWISRGSEGSGRTFLLDEARVLVFFFGREGFFRWREGVCVPFSYESYAPHTFPPLFGFVCFFLFFFFFVRVFFIFFLWWPVFFFFWFWLWPMVYTLLLTRIVIFSQENPTGCLLPV